MSLRPVNTVRPANFCVTQKVSSWSSGQRHGHRRAATGHLRPASRLAPGRMNNRSSRLRYARTHRVDTALTLGVARLGPVGLNGPPGGRSARRTTVVAACGGRCPAAGKNERAQLLELVVEGVAVRLEFVDPLCLDPQWFVLIGLLERRREVGADVEEVVLHTSEHCNHVIAEPTGRHSNADRRVRLVDIGTGGESCVGLACPPEVAEPGGAVVAGAGVDAREVDHGSHPCSLDRFLTNCVKHPDVFSTSLRCNTSHTGFTIGQGAYARSGTGHSGEAEAHTRCLRCRATWMSRPRPMRVATSTSDRQRRHAHPTRPRRVHRARRHGSRAARRTPASGPPARAPPRSSPPTPAPSAPSPGTSGPPAPRARADPRRWRARHRLTGTQLAADTTHACGRVRICPSRNSTRSRHHPCLWLGARSVPMWALSPPVDLSAGGDPRVRSVPCRILLPLPHARSVTAPG